MSVPKRLHFPVLLIFKKIFLDQVTRLYVRYRHFIDSLEWWSVDGRAVLYNTCYICITRIPYRGLSHSRNN